MYILIILIVGYAVLEVIAINLLFPHFMDLKIVNYYAEIFNKTAIGFGSIMGGLAGFNYISSYLEKEKAKRKKKEYQKLYPEKEIGKGEKYKFGIIAKEGSGKLYLYDRNHNTKRHIGNYETYVDLGWNAIDIDKLSEKEFNKIDDEKKPILISGKIGT